LFDLRAAALLKDLNEDYIFRPFEAEIGVLADDVTGFVLSDDLVD